MQKTMLSTAEVARLFNVTETTVKRWADDGILRCQRTPGGHRKFLIAQVVEFAEVNHFEPTGVLEFTDSDALAPAIHVAVLSRDFPVLVDAFIRKALAQGRSSLSTYLSYLYAHRIHLWEIFDLILHPALQSVGEMWERGEISLTQEHRLSYGTLDALGRLQAQILIKPATGSTALCACLGEELHEIGLRCACSLLESEGWSTHYLGARVPSRDLRAAITGLRPEMVLVSVTCPGVSEDLGRQLAELGGEARGVGARCVLGGRGVDRVIAGEAWEVLSSSKGLLDYLAGDSR
jgi:excisionase family DNA binding protein